MSITFWLSNWVLKYYFPPEEINPISVEDTTGAVNIVEQFVWDFELPIIDNIELAINSGVRGKDFISIVPYSQPNITSETKDGNNPIMWKYLSKYKTEFTIPSDKTNWYIIFVTSKKIAKDRDMFLWIRWKTDWEIHKDESLATKRENRYLYDMKKVPVAKYKYWRDLFALSINWKIQIWAFVWETDNKVEKIIMVFY